MRKIVSYLIVVAASIGLVTVPHSIYYDHPELLLLGLTNRW